MKNIRKKILGSFMIIIILAVIGVTVVSAQTEDGLFWGGRGLFAELTDEQREDLQTTIQQKLEEYGIEMPTRDEILEKQIERTEQRLEILNRQKELRDEGYEWDDIRDIIEEEFDLEFPAGEGQGMMFGHGFRCGPCRGPRGFISGEDSDL